MNVFYWRDQPIEDIEAWAKERGERMVEVTFKVRGVNPYAGKNAISYHEEKEVMPESFINTLRSDDRRYPIKRRFINSLQVTKK